MEAVKVITMYLPQFHRVKENDEWWGEGFTEWTAVRKAKPLFEGHYQPREPQHNNYYDLLDKSTMKWQADLMHTYDIDAQCIYHYWFKDGRRILEKPAENLLEWKDIDMPFCLCWANETWARSWSHIADKNAWADSFEKEHGKEDSGILLEQQYGGEPQWRIHFNYLAKFFQDKRYIKKNNKPIFVIYRPKLIPCFDKMMAKWQEWAAEEGFPGLYIVAANCEGMQYKYADIELCQAPMQALAAIKAENRDKDNFQVEYQTVWNEILENNSSHENQAYGGFVGYDDTPRRGNQGTVVCGTSPETFKNNLSELIAKNVAAHNDLIFLNAWNEWGEGMYLEPDQCFGEQYLQAVKYAKEQYKVYLEKYLRMDYKEALVREKNRLEEKALRYEKYWKILDEWLYLKETNTSLERILEKRNIHSVAIYGMGMLGKHLLTEFQSGSVQVRYGIDVRNDKIKAGIQVYSLDDRLPETDAIIVTVPYAFDEIKDKLEAKTRYKILSLEELILGDGVKLS